MIKSFKDFNESVWRYVKPVPSAIAGAGLGAVGGFAAAASFMNPHWKILPIGTTPGTGVVALGGAALGAAVGTAAGAQHGWETGKSKDRDNAYKKHIGAVNNKNKEGASKHYQEYKRLGGYKPERKRTGPKGPIEIDEGLNPFTPTLSHEHVREVLHKVTSEHGMSGIDGRNGIDLKGGPLRKSDFIRVNYTPRHEDQSDEPIWRKKNKLTITHHEKVPGNRPAIINKFDYVVKDKTHLHKILGEFHSYLTQEKVNTDSYHAEVKAAHEKAEQKKAERKARIEALMAEPKKKTRKPRKKKVINNDEQT